MDDWLRKVVANNNAICQTLLELQQELKRATREQEKKAKQRPLECENGVGQRNAEPTEMEVQIEEAEHNHLPAVQPCVLEPTIKEQFDTRRFYMSEETFGELYGLLAPPDGWQGDFSHAADLAIALEYLTSGGRENQLALAYKLTKPLLAVLVKYVCNVVCDALAPDYMPEWTEEQLLRIAEDFNAKWNFPHCVGAVAAHPLGQWNRGQVIAVIAVCDANYRFTKLFIDTFHQNCNFHIFKNRPFGGQLFKAGMPFPADAMLDNVKLPYFLVGGTSEPHHLRIMRAFTVEPKILQSEAMCVFNDRFERARRCIETAYGVLITRWRCMQLLRSSSARRRNSEVNACGLLHNFLLAKSRELYCPVEYTGYEDHCGVWVEGTWRQHQNADLVCLKDLPGCKSPPSCYTRARHNSLKNYLNSPAGALPQQRWKRIPTLRRETE